jgi:hypothetical protein
MADYVSEISECAKFGCNPSARGFSAQTWNISFCDCFLLTSFPSSRARVERLNRFLYSIPHYMRIDPRRCLWRNSCWKKIFSWGKIPSLKLSEGIFSGNPKAIKLFKGERRKVPTANRHHFGVKESNGDIISGPARPLAAEIDIPPISARRKPLLPSKRYKIDEKCCWNTNRKPWSLNRLTSLPSDAVESDIPL